MPDTPFERSIDALQAEVREHMMEARAHYGENHQVLGIRGQFADIWRKIGPLKRALWEGVKLTRESPRQICIDLIGHLMLTLMLMDEGQTVSEWNPGPEITTPWFIVQFNNGVSPEFMAKVARKMDELREEQPS